MTVNFGIIGVGGYIAPRHLKAIHDTGNRLLAAVDIHDAVGVMDRFFPTARFFTEIERFDRHLEKQRREQPSERIQFMSICTPNYLHDAHVRLALRLKAHAICEKPLVISPWNLEGLEAMEQESGAKVYNILQLRVHPDLIELKKKIDSAGANSRFKVSLKYITARGPWYQVSWKGIEEKSGGIATNIGIHFFDLLLWLFGPLERSLTHTRTAHSMSGTLNLARADVDWLLSVRHDDLPAATRMNNKAAYRLLTVDGTPIEFSDGFTDLHTRVYEDILSGGGFGIRDARPAIELAHRIRTSDLVSG